MDSLFKKLEQIQQKPVYVKKRYALIVTTTIFSLILIVWISTFSAELDRIKREQEGKDNGKSPSALIGAFFHKVGEDIGTMKKGVGGEVDYVRSQVSTSAIEEIKQAIAESDASGTPSLYGSSTTSVLDTTGGSPN